MRQVREVLRLKWACGLSDRKIAQSVRISRPTVAEYVRRAQAAGLTWPLSDALDDVALERRLFPTAAHTPATRRPLPDWAKVHQELKRKGVTLVLLWQEYKASTPDGLQYSQFKYRKFKRPFPPAACAHPVPPGPLPAGAPHALVGRSPGRARGAERLGEPPPPHRTMRRAAGQRET
jgi:hypothetical protein